MGCQLPLLVKKNCCNGSCSDVSPVNILAWSVLGPLLFIIYINKVAHWLQTWNLLYADHNPLYRPVCSTADLICLLEETSLGLWANSVNLCFNPWKWLYRGGNMLQLNVQLLLNGQPVDFVDSIRYFGLTISADLSWSKQVTSNARQLVGLLFRQFYKHASTHTIWQYPQTFS